MCTYLSHDCLSTLTHMGQENHTVQRKRALLRQIVCIRPSIYSSIRRESSCLPGHSMGLQGEIIARQADDVPQVTREHLSRETVLTFLVVTNSVLCVVAAPVNCPE